MSDELRDTQRWFLGALLGGEAVDRAPVDALITASDRLEPGARLQVYTDAYWLRLVECLGDQFPACKRLIGDEAFDAMAAAYLRDHPSTSYTLDALGDRFGEWLDATRPADDPDWARVLAEVARLELTIGGVFDGPGVEEQPTLDGRALEGVDPDAFWQATLTAAPCVRTLTFSFPVNALYTALRAQDIAGSSAIPDPRPQHIVLYRRDWVVRRYEASAAETALLEQLIGGRPVGVGIEAALATGGVHADALGEALHGWFADWVRLGFFLELTLSAA